MARFLSWQHLNKEQLVALRTASSRQDGPSARQVLQQCVFAGQQQPAADADQGLLADVTAEEQRRETTLNLFSYALKQGQAWGFDDERLSVLFGLVKEVHDASVKQRLTVERSFAFFKDTLLNHSVHRPPFSCGVFSQAEMQAVLDWMLNTYYQHYKLYQYAFTKRVTLSITTFHPSSLVEVPFMPLPPLSEALTEQQHQQELDEQQRQVNSALLNEAEEQQRHEAEEAAAAAEAAAALAVQLEYEASLPDDVKEKVAAALEREVAYLKQKMDQRFQAQQAGLLAKLAQLEGRAAAGRS